MKRTFAGLILLGLVVSTGDAPAGRMTADDRAALAKICKHYVNRARFKARSDNPEFVVRLADGCLSAQASLDSGPAEERVAAVRFLTRLQELRDLVIDMNMTRVFGKDYTPYTRIGYGSSGRTEPMPKVSASGEYLIAHSMGLIAAYNAWLDTGPQMALASEREQ